MNTISEPTPTARRGGASLDDLIALNDEIAALARAGMPLERGLIGVGGDLPGRLGTIASGLGRRMEDGETLIEALGAEGGTVPATYRAVVEAGLRSGRLAEALEGLTGFARSYVELRRAIGLALLYPLLVVVLSYGLFVLFVVDLMPRMVAAFTSLRVPVNGMMRGTVVLGTWVAYWGPILPIVLMVGLLVWWSTGRASAFRPGQVGWGLRWVPGVSKILDGATTAQFADWLALLVEHGVPWDQSVLLAAEATGDPRWADAATTIAESTRRGEPISDAIQRVNTIPPLLAWLMSEGRGQEALVAALKHAADTYRRRAFRRAATMRVVLPTVLLLVIGGTATLIYTMSLFAPWTALLRGMTRLH